MRKLFLYLLFFVFLTTCWAKRYEYQNYSSILQKMTDLSGNYSRYCKLHDAKKEYNYLIDTSCGDSKCEHWYLEITDFDAPSEQINVLPQVLYVGGVHGDEVLGPNVVMNLAEHLLQNAESDTDIQNLVKSRLFILLPLANPSGFYANKKEEIQSSGVQIDPALDFPYNIQDNQCLRTSTSRVINYLFKTYLIQAALVFQGDKQIISYPWGASNHVSDPAAEVILAQNSPDNQVFSDVARILSTEAGSNNFLFIKQYPTGKIADKTGTQNGGLADWAYSGSWEKPSVLSKCDDSSQAVPLPATETDYESGSLRALVYIAQASYQKAPAVAYLGSSEGLSVGQDQYAYGYIPMNIKLGLTLADIVEPYVKLKDVKYSAEENTITVQWQGGGCKEVDDTRLEWTNKVGKKTFSNQFESQQGSGYYENSDFVFQEVIKLNSTDFNLALTIRLTCDQDWAQQKDPLPAVAPQTHVVQVRLNQDYSVENNGYKITGKNVVQFNVKDITPLYFNQPANDLSLMMELFPCDGTMGSGGVVRGELKQNADTFDLVFTGQLNVEDTTLQGHLYQYGEISKCEQLAGDMLNVVTLQSDKKYENSLLFGMQSGDPNSLEVNSKLAFADKEAISNLIGRSVMLQNVDYSGTNYIAQIVPVQPTSCTGTQDMTGCVGVDLGSNQGVCIVKSPLADARNHFKLFIQSDVIKSRVKISGFVPTPVIDLYRNFPQISIAAEGATNTFNVNTEKVAGYGMIEENTLNLNPNVALGTTLRVYSQVLGDDVLIGECSIVLNNPSFNETEYLLTTLPPPPTSDNRRLLLIGAGCAFAVLAIVVVCLLVKKCRQPPKLQSPKGARTGDAGRRASPPKAQQEKLPGKHIKLYESSDDELH